MVTYAQNFEDVLLRRALSEIERGFYIDIGAFHPVVDSVTCWFYSQGWNGINVEPNPRFQALLREARPHDLNLEFAVTGETGEIELYLLDGLSTTVTKIADQHERAGRTADKVRVPALSLNDLFAQYVGEQTVDFLKIDVEGAEAKILDTCPFEIVRPRLIVVEATKPNSVTQCAEAWEPGLLSKGYAFCYFDGLNRYYARDEDAWRINLFDAPPNVFDAFRLPFTDNRVDYVSNVWTLRDQVPEGGIQALIADRDRMQVERDQWFGQAQTFLADRDEFAVALQTERSQFAEGLVKLSRDMEAGKAEEAARHAADLVAWKTTHAQALAEQRAKLAEREAELADLKVAYRDALARLSESESRAESLSTARDVSVLKTASLQIKLDALRISAGRHRR